eukprot:TRINITY_DN12773_c0_g1_i1.p1 TRINITY_DN12773_c0_g1~~TRINITY_DN12773_c0_g1_i1.p1  ORF type:complete len:250 (+),score=24.32 TRINITY_DN12773_c0_g1_i1:1-750(+)
MAHDAPSIPDDVLIKLIFSQLTCSELLTVQQVCLQWRRCAKDASLWRYVNFGMLAETRRLDVSRQWLKDLGSRPTLNGMVQLDLEKCDGVDDSAIEAVTATCKQLERLNLADCRQLSDASLTFIGQRCPSLLCLSVRGCRSLTDKGLSNMASGCKLLQYLDIGFIHDITGSFVQQAGGLCQLRHLYLRNVRQWAGASLVELVKSNPPLSYLNCQGCYRIDAFALEMLANSQSVRTIQRLDLRHTTQCNT